MTDPWSTDLVTVAVTLAWPLHASKNGRRKEKGKDQCKQHLL